MATLTAKQQRFVDEYLIDLNATQAAIRAKYSVKTAEQMGHQLLKKTLVQNAISEALEAIHSAKIADSMEVMQYLTSVMRGEHTEQVPILCGDGMQELTNKDVGAKDRLKAAELLGKRYALFTDKLNVEGAIPVVIKDDLEAD